MYYILLFLIFVSKNISFPVIKEDWEIKSIVERLGLDEELFRALLDRNLDETTLNDGQRFDTLIETVDLSKAQIFLEERDGEALKGPKIKIRITNTLRKFILKGKKIDAKYTT